MTMWAVWTMCIFTTNLYTFVNCCLQNSAASAQGLQVSKSHRSLGIYLYIYIYIYVCVCLSSYMALDATHVRITGSPHTRCLDNLNVCYGAGELGNKARNLWPNNKLIVC